MPGLPVAGGGGGGREGREGRYRIRTNRNSEKHHNALQRNRFEINYKIKVEKTVDKPSNCPGQKIVSISPPTTLLQLVKGKKCHNYGYRMSY